MNAADRLMLLGAMLLFTHILAASPPEPATSPRGYIISPRELAEIADKARRGVQPYRDAVLSVKKFGNTGALGIRDSDPNPTFWPLGTVSGSQKCPASKEPAFLAEGSALVEAKALIYQLMGDSRYAADVRKHILELTTTRNFGGEIYSGANQCILNLSWYIPGWIIAADLIADSPAWAPSDKQTFQNWLAREVYKKTEWASDHRSNNWGAAASATSAIIADYVSDSGIALIGRNGEKLSAAEAYSKANRRQLDRMSGNAYMDNYNCHRPVGIRPDGGIPEELSRGPAGCDGRWIPPPATLKNKSYMYQQTFVQALTLHAEFLLRRGDSSIYDHVDPDGGGSLLRAVHFIIHNPNDPSHSANWWLNANGGTLEVLYRYYRDPYIAQQLGIGTGRRHICVRGSSAMLHFGTITHGFGVNEKPASPPTVRPPSARSLAAKVH